jgi:erythromycin esterase
MDEAVGAARVAAIGESAHYNREFFQLRHRVLSYLAEGHHFTAYLLESGIVEGSLVNDWVRGG